MFNDTNVKQKKDDCERYHESIAKIKSHFLQDNNEHASCIDLHKMQLFREKWISL